MIVVLKQEPDVTVDDLLAVPFSVRSPEDRERIVSQGRPTRPIFHTVFDDLPFVTASSATRRFYCWYCLLFDDNPGGVWNREVSEPGLLRIAAEIHQATPVHLQAYFRLLHFDQLNKVTVDDLLAVPFSARSPEDRERIVLQGRPTRAISHTVFDDLPFLTASAATRRFYCWYCLLFDDNPGGVWNRADSEPGLLRTAAEEHQASPAHIQASFQMLHFDQLNNARKGPAPVVARDRHHPEAARRLADAACSLATMQGGPDYLKTLALLRKYDSSHKGHSDEAIRWLQSSPDLLGRVVAAVAKVARRKVAEAVRGSQYVALVLSRHSEGSVSSILRYVRDGQVEERFLGFAPVPASEGVPAVYRHVRALLREMDAGPKLVALSPDAGVVEAGDRDALLERLRHDDSPLCRLAPWHSHTPDRVLRQCLQRRRPTFKKFFACFRFLERAFRERPELCAAAPEAEALRDALSARDATHFLRYVQRQGLLLAQLFDSDDGPSRILGPWLREATTTFLLDVLAHLSVPAAALGAALRGYVPERQFCLGGSVALAASDLLREVRRLMLRGSSAPGWWEEALEDVAAEVRARYCDLDRFRFCLLFDFLEEGWFKHSDASLRNLVACYDLGGAANMPRARSELEVLWTHMAFSKRSAYDFHQHLHDSHLKHTFRSLFDFSELVLAMPFKHVSLERDTSLFDRIVGWDGLPDDACLLSLEADYLREVRQQPGFYDEVLNILSD